MAKKTTARKSTTRKTAKTRTKKTSRKGARRSSGKKPRPNLTNVRKEMKRLRDDLTVIIAAEEDQQGELNAQQLQKAKQTKAGLDAALQAVDCGQTLAPY